MTGILTHRFLTFACRMVLGITLAVAGGGKLPHQADLVDLTAKLGLAGIVPEVVSRAGAWALPPLEIALGMLFVAGLFLRFASGLNVLLVFGFIAVNVLSILRGGTADECGCFGDVAVVSTSNALFIDIAMLLMSAQVLFHRGEFLSLDSRR